MYLLCIHFEVRLFEGSDFLRLQPNLPQVMILGSVGFPSYTHKELSNSLVKRLVPMRNTGSRYRNVEPKVDKNKASK